MGRSRYFIITPQNTLERADTLPEALLRREEGGFIWLDFADPSLEELTALVEPLGLHPLAIEDCLDEDQVPKMEEFEGHTFILFNRYRYAADVAAVEEVNFFLGERLLVTVHSHGAEDASFAERLEATVRRDLAQARKGPDFLLQVILDDIVDEKFGAIEALQDQLDATEDELLGRPAEFRPAKLIHLRRTLLRLRKSLVYEREILVKMCRRDSPFITEDAIYDFRDIYDHLAKFFEVVEICRELIASVMEIHLSMVNNQMTMVANKTNQVVRRLTMITTVFMPLTLLAGIGGMSEWSMMTGPHHWRVAYPAFLGAMALIGLANFLLLKWLDSRDKTEVLLYPYPSASEPEERAPPGAAQKATG
jgi:magnesium transporter